MNIEKKNMEPDALPDNTESVIRNTGIIWNKSKEEVWLEMEKRIDSKNPDARVIVMKRTWPKLAIAASVAILAGLAAFMELYTRTISTPAGQHAEVYLPDKSVVKMNAESEIAYKPFLWAFRREVIFEGEAYFDVKRGKQFIVLSGSGTTTVMGTSFNIYSRNNDYQVTCISGKVKVQETAGSREVFLTPGQKSSFGETGALIVESDIDTVQALAWLSNKFSFTSVPLRKVFEEIGRQYGIMIDVPPDIDYIYTGSFVKDISAENVLKLVCRPFDLTFARKSEKEYAVSKNN